MDWRLFIRMAKADEEAARAKYRLAAEAAKSPAIKAIFDNLAYEEEMHIAVLDNFDKDLESLLANDMER